MEPLQITLGVKKWDNYPSYGGKISTSKITLDEIGRGAGNGLDKHSRLPSMKSAGQENSIKTKRK